MNQGLITKKKLNVKALPDLRNCEKSQLFLFDELMNIKYFLRIRHIACEWVAQESNLRPSDDGVNNL